MKEYIDDVKSGGIVLGDSLETALELGEKHEAFVSKCKNVSLIHVFIYIVIVVYFCL